MQFKKHIHADLIKEYARQKAEGELQYFCWEYYNELANEWRESNYPVFLELDKYRFRMRETHPDYFPELKLGDKVQLERFTGMVCKVDNKFYIICTKNEGFVCAAEYVNLIGALLFSEGHESLEKLTARCKTARFKIEKS